MKKNHFNEWQLAEFLRPSNLSADDRFGAQVAISGDYAVVTAPEHSKDASGNNSLNDAGAAYIYERDGTGDWNMVQKIVASDRASGEFFGEALALDGDRIIIGSYLADAVYIFERNGSGVWIEEQILLSNDIVGGDFFGFSVAINGDFAVVGASRENATLSGFSSVSSAGSAYIFERNGSGVWNQIQKIVASDRELNDEFGTSVAIDGDYLIVGATQEDHNTAGLDFRNRAGSAYIFEKDGSGTWNEVQKVTEFLRAAGSEFGHSVSLKGDRVIVTEASLYAGASVFERDGSDNWNYQEKLINEGYTYNDASQSPVALSSEGMAIVGINLEGEDEFSNRTFEGAAYIYTYCEPTSSTINLTVCEPYLAPSQTQTFTVSGNYTDVIPNTRGCDSTISINLIVNQNPPTINPAGPLVICSGINETLSIPAVGGASYCYFKNEQWDNVGSSVSSGVGQYTTLTFDVNDIPYVVFRDEDENFTPSVKKFDGNNWVFVGAPRSIEINPIGNDLDMAISQSNTPYVTYRAGFSSGLYRATVKRFDGTDWIKIGSNEASTGEVRDVNIAFGEYETPYIAYKDVDNGDKATVMKYEAGFWEPVGNIAFSSGSITGLSLVVNNNNVPYVAFSDDNNSNKATVMKYNGTTWVNVGAAGFTSGASYVNKLALNNSGTLHMASYDVANGNKATVYKFNGSSWVTVGTAGFSAGMANDIDFGINEADELYVAYRDNANSNKLTVMTYDGIDWVPAGDIAFSEGDVNTPSIAFGAYNKPYVAYRNLANGNKISVEKIEPVCIGNSNSLVINTTGTYNVEVTASDGCISYAANSVTVTNGTNTTATISPTVCESYTVPSGDETYNISGNYTDTILNTSGCDSVLTINLTILNSSSATLNIDTCAASYTVPSGDKTYTVNGTYSDTISNAVGCDSILTINLTINNNSFTNQYETTVDSFMWSSNGITYYESGVYTNVLPNSVGCDSVITLYLTIEEESFYNEIQKIVAADRTADDNFGQAVDVDGSFAIVGAHRDDYFSGGFKTDVGSAYIFEKGLDGTWTQAQKLTPSDVPTNTDYFGYSVAISGNYAVIGAFLEDEGATGFGTVNDAGSAYVFERDVFSNTWSQTAKIVAFDRATGDYFGSSVDIYGDYIVVGAPSEDEDAGGGNTLSGAGSVYIFKRSGANWNFTTKLVHSDRDASDGFGAELSLFANKLIVGVSGQDLDASGGNSLTSAGAAYIFERDGLDNWSEMQKLVASERKSSDFFGASVSISDSFAVVGASGEDEDASGGNTLSSAGALYTFKLSASNVWSQTQKLVASDRAAFDVLGKSVKIEGDWILAGVPFEDHDTSGLNQLSSSGSVYVFNKDILGAWSETQKLVASDRAINDNYGFPVAISGAYLFSAAKLEDEDENDANTKTDAGSVYILGRCGTAFSFINETACNFYISPSGKKFNTNGIYEDTVTTQLGCDSIITITLDILNNTFSPSPITVSSCYQYTWPLNGLTYTTSGTYKTALTNSMGCDSIITLDLTITSDEIPFEQITSFSDSTAYDYLGSSVAIDGEFMVAGAPGEDQDVNGNNTINGAGSAFMYQKGLTGEWEFAQKIVASDRAANDEFGTSVDIHGDYMIVGVPFEDHDEAGGSFMTSAGSAYIFEKDGSGNWSQVQKIVSADRAINDQFGISVAIYGNYAFVGATGQGYDENGGNFLSLAGAAYIFERDGGGNWTQIKKVVATDRVNNDNFGGAIDVYKDYAIISAAGQGYDENGGNLVFGAGAVYAYKFDSEWREFQKIVSSERFFGDAFGTSVSIAGNYFVASARGQDRDENGGNFLSLAGAAYIFEYDNTGIWSEMQKIVASDRAANDGFGNSVAISGNQVVVGATSEDEDENGNNTLNASGSAYYFETEGTIWTEKKKLVSNDREIQDGYGSAVAISEGTLAVGASGDRLGSLLYGAGAVYILDRVTPQSNITEVACGSYTTPSGNQTYSASGIYTDILPSASGCDSVIIIDLTINNNSFNTLNVDACDSYTVPSGDETYTASGTYMDTIPNAVGCDSILTINLNYLGNSSSSFVSVTECDEYIFNGEIYATTGVYDIVIPNSAGCDSNITLDLTINYSNATYVEAVKAVASDRAIDDEFGHSVAISGQYAVVGARYEDEDESGNNTLSTAGSVYIFKQDVNGDWNEVQKIVASDRATGDNFGQDVAIDGDYIVVGASFEGSPKPGAAYIFQKDGGGIWNEVQKLQVSGEFNYAEFGHSVDIDNDLIVVGARYAGLDAGGANSMTSAGAAYVFKRDGGGTWSEVQKLVASDRANFDNLGTDVTISQDRIAVGGPFNDLDENGLNSLSNSGGVYIFEEDGGGTWTQIQKVVASDRDNGDNFGYSLSVSGNTLLVGAYNEKEDQLGGNTLNAAGSAYIFERDGGGIWAQTQKVVAEDRASNDYFGYSVSMSGSFGLIGAYRSKRDAEGLNAFSSAGAAYIFKKNIDGGWSQLEKVVPSDRASNDEFAKSVAISGANFIAGASFEDENETGTSMLSKAGSVYFFEQELIAVPVAVSACESYTVPSGDETYTVSGMYMDTIQTISGCDSLLVIDVTINNHSSATINPSVCGSYTVPSGDEIYTVSGTYNDTIANTAGCDSLLTINLTINGNSSSTEDTTVCDSYTWNGGTYTVSGTYYDTIPTGAACDSFLTLNLVVNYSSSSTETITACDSYMWNGMTFNSSGTYRDTIPNGVNCDSFMTLNLTINNSTSASISPTACESYTVPSGDETYSVSGMYSDTIPNAANCDSIITINLTINNNSSSSETETACESYIWNGMTFTSSGTYFDTIPNTISCDSFMTLNLTINNNSSSTETVSACGNYDWNGTNYTVSGVYRDTIPNAINCDSFMTLNLTISDITTATISPAACETYTVPSGDETYIVSGNYMDTILNVGGCDSIITINLTINNHTSATLNESVCNIYTVPSGDETYTMDGTYLDTIANTAGCDSILTINLTILGTSSSTEDTMVCDSYIWNGNTYTVSGTYYDTIPTGAACDSFLTLNLVVNNSTNDTVEVVVCPGTDYVLPGGATVNTAGFYRDTLMTASNCDSIINTDFKFAPIYDEDVDAAICQGESYTLPSGLVVNTGGVYRDTLLTNNNCDSITNTTLIVNPTYIINISDTVCQGQGYELPRGEVVFIDSIYTDTLMTEAGCDSIIIVDLSVDSSGLVTSEFMSFCEGETYTLPWGDVIDSAGIFIDPTIVGCDTFTQYVVTVNPVYNIIDFIVICAGDSIELFGEFVSKPDIYEASFTTSDGCDSNITIEVIYDNFAGADQALTICDTFTNFDLSTVITADADTNGIWIDVNGTGAISGSMFDASGVTAGTYTVKYATPATGSCENDTATFTVTVQPCLNSGIVAVEIPNIEVFPNPAKDKLNIKSNTQMNILSVYNTLGQLYLEYNAVPRTLDVSNWIPGVYFIEITHASGVQQIKVVKH